MFSIIIPTLNNINYLKVCLDSLNKNSSLNNEILVHVSIGNDGTTDYLKQKNINYTFTDYNAGICEGVNTAAKKSKMDYILYAHDDMYFCKNWDKYLIDEINKQKNNFYYLSGTNVSTRFGLINYNCGDTFENFDENKFLKFCIDDNTPDLQSAHWAPHLIHRELWDKIGGFSEEFNPGDGSDPDFCMKLWLENVRIFKGISKFKVYHFNSLTTRNNKVTLNNGTKIFLLKYGFNPKFFRKYYLKGNNSIIPYRGILDEPKNNFFMFIELLVNKLKYLFYKFKF